MMMMMMMIERLFASFIAGRYTESGIATARRPSVCHVELS